MTSANVSARATFFLKLLLPTFWSFFFGGMAFFVLFFLPENVQAGALGRTGLKVLVFSFAASSAGLLWWVSRKLHRVDMDTDTFFVTDYLKAARYTLESVAKVEQADWGLVSTVSLVLHEPGIFGQRITFLKGYQFDLFLQKFPEVAQRLRIAE
jgi:hypothetical protein